MKDIKVHARLIKNSIELLFMGLDGGPLYNTYDRLGRLYYPLVENNNANSIELNNFVHRINLQERWVFTFSGFDSSFSIMHNVKGELDFIDYSVYSRDNMDNRGLYRCLWCALIRLGFIKSISNDIC